MMEKWAEVVGVWMKDNKVKDNRIRDLMKYVKQVIRENSEIQEKVKSEKMKFEKELEENVKLREKIKDQSWKMNKLNKIIVGLQSDVNELKSKLDEKKSIDFQTTSSSTLLNRNRGSCPDLFQVPLKTDSIKHKPPKNPSRIENLEHPSTETFQYISDLKSKIEDLEKNLKESFNTITQLTHTLAEEKFRFEETINKLQQDLIEKTMTIDQIKNENSLNSKYFERKIKEKQIESSKLTEELEVAKRVNKKLLADLENITQEKSRLNGKVIGKKQKIKEDFRPMKVFWNTPQAKRASLSGSFFAEEESEPSLYLSKSDNESQSPSRISSLFTSESNNSLAPNPKSSLYKIIISTPKDSPKTVPLLNRRKTLKIQVSPSTSP